MFCSATGFGKIMIVLVQANVLTVGLDGRNEVLSELPIRLIALDNAADAASSLKNEKVDGVISNWDIKDAGGGRFLRKLKAAKPDISTIVFIRANDREQEISARSLGVSAVLTEDSSDELFLETVANVLGLKSVVAIKTISPLRQRRQQSIRQDI